MPRFNFAIAIVALICSMSFAQEPDDETGVSKLKTRKADPPASFPSHLSNLEDGISFTHGWLTKGKGEHGIHGTTAMTFGPDGRLYAAQYGGRIVVLTLDGTSIVNSELFGQIDFDEAEKGDGVILGLAFNPNGPDPNALCVSHTVIGGGVNGPAYPGKVSRIERAGAEAQVIISGLPASVDDHGTNKIAFTNDNKLLISNAGNTNAGFPIDPMPRPETPLSGAMLVADIYKPGFDGTVQYDQPGVASHTVNKISGDVDFFAFGLRNTFDFVLHSNGNIYGTDNATNLADGIPSLGPDKEGTRGPESPDELNLIKRGAYYGHPNRNRGRTDYRQNIYYPASSPSADHVPPIATLGLHTAAVGIAEYSSAAFDGKLEGDLVYVDFTFGRIWRVKMRRDGQSVESIARLHGNVFKGAVDVAIKPDGTILIAQIESDDAGAPSPGAHDVITGGGISFLKPINEPDVKIRSNQLHRFLNPVPLGLVTNESGIALDVLWRELLSGKSIIEVLESKNTSTGEVVDALATANRKQVDYWTKGKGWKGERYTEPDVEALHRRADRIAEHFIKGPFDLSFAKEHIMMAATDWGDPASAGTRMIQSIGGRLLDLKYRLDVYDDIRGGQHNFNPKHMRESDIQLVRKFGADNRIILIAVAKEAEAAGAVGYAKFLSVIASGAFGETK